MQTEEKYKEIELALVPYKKMMAGATDTILDNEVTDYPIFVAHQVSAVDIGLPLVDKTARPEAWSINASSLEEFATKQLISPEKVDDFQQIYKDPKSYLCVFIIHKIGATFVFIPRD